MIAVYTKLLRLFARDRFPRGIRLSVDEKLLRDWEHMHARNTPRRLAFTKSQFERWLRGPGRHSRPTDFFEFTIEDPEARRYLPKKPSEYGTFQLVNGIESVKSLLRDELGSLPKSEAVWKTASLQLLGTEHYYVFPPRPRGYWVGEIEGRPREFRKWRLYCVRRWYGPALSLRERRLKRLVRQLERGGALTPRDRALVDRTARAFNYTWTAAGETVALDGIQKASLSVAGKIVGHLRHLLRPDTKPSSDRKTKFGRGVDRDARLLVLTHVVFRLEALYRALANAQAAGLLSSKVSPASKRGVVSKFSGRVASLRKDIAGRHNILPPLFRQHLLKRVDHEAAHLERMARREYGDDGMVTYPSGRAAQERFVQANLGWFIRHVYPKPNRPAVATVRREMRKEMRSRPAERSPLPMGFVATRRLRRW